MRRNSILALALIGIGCGGPSERAPEPERQPVVAEVETAALREVQDVAEATGTIEPWARISLAAEIMGRIASIPVREGDAVGGGQVLVKLEFDRLDAAVAQARAAVTMAEASAEDAAALRRRYEALQGRGSVTERALEQAVAGDDVAAAAVDVARANLRVAEVSRDHAEVRSPVDGVVTRRLAEPGDMATPGTPLLVLEDLSRVRVELAVAESDAVGLSAGDAVRIRVDVLNEEWAAVVDRVFPAGDPASRTFRVQVVLPNPGARLRSGLFARAALPRGTRTALVIPASAVVERGQLRGLFVVDGAGRARLRWVRLGRSLDDGYEVLSGLAAGDRFLLAPPAGAVDGAPVREA